jgi:hypothetical protein
MKSRLLLTGNLLLSARAEGAYGLERTVRGVAVGVAEGCTSFMSLPPPHAAQRRHAPG